MVNSARYLTSLLFAYCLTIASYAPAQPTSQDCLGAVPVCSNLITSTGMVNGTGNITNEINPGTSCMLTGERNDKWYLIQIGNSGLLNFSVIPVNLTENYNWALYNITGTNCAAIFTNPGLEIACNYSANAGVTGANGLAGPQNQPPVAVTAGQILVLNVSAFSSITQSGYTLDFTATNNGILNNQPPFLQNVSALNCGATSIGLTFSEMIACGTLTPADLQLTGPGGPYTISGVTAPNCSAGGGWSKSFTVSFSPALTASGNYTISLLNPVNDLCGNLTPMPQSFTFPVTAMNVTFNSTNVTCYGGNNGAVTAVVTGSAGPFTYQWSPSGGSSATAQFLTAGTYTVTVTNSGGCSVTASTNITQPLSGLTATASVTPANGCAANGSATINVSNGQPPFTYSWWPSGGNNATATGLAAGSYMVTITDANQCALNYFLNVPSASGPVATITNVNDVSCFSGNDGSATVTVTGASGPFIYNWSPSGGNAATASGLTAGNYTVTVQVNATCILTAAIVITEPPSPLTLNPVVTPSTCGNNNGTVQLNVSGSVPPYNYSWSPAVSTSGTAQNLSPGNYSVLVTDANGCTISQNLVINASAAPVVTVTAQQNITCFGINNGSLTVLASGGLFPFSYSWSNGQTTAAIGNLSAGSYSVVVTDASGCTGTVSATITQPSLLVLSQNQITHVLCFGQATGSLGFTASGGSPGYVWQWSGGIASGNSAVGLIAGTYTVTVTDQQGCTAMSQSQITEPAAPIQIQALLTNTTCGNSNGAVALTVSGGTSPYQFLWSNNSTTATINALQAGIYSVTVSDANGCTMGDNYLVQATGAPLLTQVNVVDVSCNGGNDGSIAMQAVGGVVPYTWQWSSGGSVSSSVSQLMAGSYTVTVTDADGCQAFDQINIFEPSALNVVLPASYAICQGIPVTLNPVVSGGTAPYQFLWNTGASSQSLIVQPLNTTNFSVTVTDANGCVGTPMLTQVAVADPLTISALYPDTVCEGKSATIQLMASGGDGNYSFVWSNGMQGASNAITIIGSISLTITLSDGCGSTPTQTNVNIIAVSSPQIAMTLIPQKGCVPLSTKFQVSGSPVGGVTYLWDFGDGKYANGFSVAHTYQSGGTYNVSLTAWVNAAPACSSQVIFPAAVEAWSKPAAFYVYAPTAPNTNSPEVYFDDRSTGAEKWFWDFDDNGATSSQSDPVHAFVKAGVYQVKLVVGNNQGCTDSLTQAIEVKDELQYFIPNAFTADNNGINDKFEPKGIGIKSYTIEIFNRWGQQIFVSANGKKAWDGTDLNGHKVPQGLYICKVTIASFTGESVTKFSTVTLLR